MHGWKLAHPFPPTPLTRLHAPASCAHCRMGALLATPGTAARVDSDGQPACEECGRRLSRCKGKLHKHEKGRICQQCYDDLRRSSSASSPPDPSAPPATLPRKRRAVSDPGEPPAVLPQPSTRSITRRVALPRPVPAPKQPRIARSHEELMRLLDETVAVRMAYEAAEAGATQQSRG